MNQPNIRVGIMSARRVEIELIGEYKVADRRLSGAQTVELSDGEIRWDGERYAEVTFEPTGESCCFELRDVTIGVGFHWERKETQRFSGALKLIVEDEKVTAVNVLPVEEYLRSVISSEMSATASLELLKAHAVISRSWLLAQIAGSSERKEAQSTMVTTDDEIVKWYDREDHKNFDVCADDHCQRYQGITRASTPTVTEAVEATCGEVLMDGEKLCDARFSKCCGGVLEEFENCWESHHHGYLSARADNRSEESFPDLRDEDNAQRWILSRPEAFCENVSASVMSQVLNSYDQETPDFYRWRVEYDRDELAEIVRGRSGIDFGDIVDLQPLARGTSGRIYRLKIVGTRRTMVVGKELEIRKWLSRSHLYSSAFVVEREEVDASGVPARIVLRGAGWGHGVGLCQIGAAVMGEQCYRYDEILLHYFKGAEIKKLY